MSRLGTLYGVGVGPGDPELLTLKAARVLSEVPVVAGPAEPDGRPGLAFRIAERHVPRDTPRLVLPREAWPAAGERVAAELRAGRSVAFIVMGDPLTYSTFAHLMQAVRKRLPDTPIVVIPGVSSVQAAAADIRAPLASGGERMAILPAMYHADELRDALREFDTVVLLKVRDVLSEVLSVLREGGRLERAALVEWAGGPGTRIWQGEELDGSIQPSYFSLMIIRRGAACQDR